MKNDKKKNPEESKRKPVLVGVTGRPFPIFGTDTTRDVDGNIVPIDTWLMREVPSDSSEDQVAIYSEKSDAEVLTTLYANLPKPTMLHIFWEGTKNRMPDSKRRLEFVKGFPGGGKTHMAMLHAQLRTNQKPIIVDCGGRNLQDLLWETILDFDSDPSFYKSLEERASKGELNSHSKELLKHALGKGYKENKDGSVEIDWTLIKNEDTVKSEIDTSLFGMSEAKYQKEVEKVTQARLKEITKTLEEVRALEFGSGNENALGLKMVPGVIYQAFFENRPLILDEYNKSKDGSDDAMQTVLQFINGETDEVTVNSPMKDNSSTGQSYTLKREDMGDLFFVAATGNAVVDGVSTRALSESANQRWQPVTIPETTVEDLEHSWTQFTCGLPISTLYEMAFKEGVSQADEDPKRFADYLKSLLISGKSEAEIAKIPPHHFDFINNWQEIQNDSLKLAKFIQKWTEVLDPENYESHSGNISEEVSEPEYKEEVAMGYRKMLMWIKDAQKQIPRPVTQSESNGIDFENFLKPYKFVEQFRKPNSLEFGDRLRDIILDDITQTTHRREKKDLYDYLMRLAEKEGLIASSKNSLNNENARLTGDAFNYSPFKGSNLEARSEIVRRELIAELKSKNPDKHHNMSDEEIVPLSHIKLLLGRLEVTQHKKHESTHSGNVFLFNKNFGLDDDTLFNTVKTVDDTPVKIVKLVNEKPDSSNFQDHPTEDEYEPLIEAPSQEYLVKEEDLLKTLVLPVIGEFNLAAFWNSAFRHSNNLVVDKSVNMAENKGFRNREAEEVFATTTVMVRNDEGEESPLHIVRNNNTGRLLIIGNDINDSLKEKFVLSHITYISRHEEGAQKRVAAALNKLTNGYKETLKEHLKNAFLHRNHASDLNRGLEDLLVANDVEQTNKHYITTQTTNNLLDQKPHIKLH